MNIFVQKLRTPPLLIALASLLGAALFVLFAVVASPQAALALIVGVGIVVTVFLSPSAAFLLTAFVVPLERTGRFSNDSATYSLSLMKMMGLLALTSFVVHQLLHRRRCILPLPFLLYTAYVAYGVFTLAFTSDSTNGIRAVSLLVGNIMFFFLTINIVRNRAIAEKAILAWLLSTTVIGVLTIYQFHRSTGAIADFDYQMTGMLTTEQRFALVAYDGVSSSGGVPRRAIGTTSHSAVYAINLILTLPFFAYFFYTTTHRWLYRAVTVGGLITIYNILLTNTRAAFLTTAVMFGLMVCTNLLRIKVRIVIGFLLVALVVMVAAPSDLSNRALNAANYSLKSEEFRERVMMWKAAGSVLADHWIIGVGIGNCVEVPRRTPMKTSTTSIHNDLLATLVETGLIGFALLTAFLVSLHTRCRAGERWFRSQGDSNSVLLCTAARLQIYTILFYGIQAETLTLPLKGFWLALGLAVALARVTAPVSHPLTAPQLAFATTR